MVVYKYPLPFRGGTIPLALPRCGQILDIAFQGDDLFLWALVDPDGDLDSYTVVIAGTGHEIAEDLRATLFHKTLHHAGFVWHVFVKSAV